MKQIQFEKTYLGIEMGSTRIKAALIDESYTVIASGSFSWENRFEDGYWTYALSDIQRGVRECYADLCNNLLTVYGQIPTRLGAIGISGMMHGYLAFDQNDGLLVPFRTWRNTTTEAAASELTDLLDFNIPQRWSIAHLCQAILNREAHLTELARITTLSGYVHHLLTGKWELGMGEASGMFPVTNQEYDKEMLQKCNAWIRDKGYAFSLEQLLPTIRPCSDARTVLTEEGAHFLDPTGTLQANIPVCAPEGDASTGMVATNSVRAKTGNVSAGTSVFSMLVLEHPLKELHTEIDVVCTPDGSPVAMVHSNNGCSELDAWIGVFEEFCALKGMKIERSELYEALYLHAKMADADCGGICAYPFLAAEPVAGVANGTLALLRMPHGSLTLANFFAAQLLGAMAVLKLGLKILTEDEGVSVSEFYAHGGLFKIKGVAQQLLADLLHTPIAVSETAGEGGAWGMALLSAYCVCQNQRELPDWLESEVFSRTQTEVCKPRECVKEGIETYFERYCSGLASLRAKEKAKC